MKKFILYAISLAFIMSIMAFEIMSPTGKAGYTGAPGEGDCTTCHTGTVNSGGATASITASPSLANGYTPGTDYTISVTLANSPAPNNTLFGVDAEALLSSGANGGTITITNTTLTKARAFTVGANSRNQVIHTGTGNTGPDTQTFSFKWTAPATGSGGVTFYASLMGADNDGTESGDQVYTKTLAVTEAAAAVPNPPALIYPANNAIDRQLTEQYYWHKATGAQSYYIQIAKDAAFTNILFQGNVGADTFKLVNNMTAETDYYWHVASVNTSGTGAYSGAWKLTTAYKPIVLQAPTNMMVNVPVDTKLTWLENPAGTQYQIQISTSPNFTSTVVDTKVSNVLEYQSTVLNYLTTYYWRVRLVVGTSNGLWSDVWSFKTSVKSPDLVYPSNNAIDRQLSEQLRWKKVTGAQSYYIQVAKDAAFTNMFFEGSAGADTFKLLSNMLAETDYYWHVASVTSDGTGPYSVAWKYKTAFKPVVLKTPENQKVNVPLNVKLTWQTSTSGSQYQIQISKTADFATTVADEKVSNVLEYQTTVLLNYQTYYWRVRVVSGASNGLWSDVWSFKTVVKTPDLQSPPNNAVDRQLSEKLLWRKATGAQSYFVQIAKDAAFATMFFEGNTAADTFKLISDLQAETDYYWHVQSVTTEGKSEYSTTWKFKTATAAANPVVLNSPENLKVNVPLDQKFSWMQHSDGSVYQIQISKMADFSTTVVDQKVTNALEYQPTVLEYYQMYYWRVGLVTGTTIGNWSEVRSFKTGIKTVDLLLPADQSTDRPTTLTFEWNQVIGAKYYHLQISKNDQFTDLAYNKDSLMTLEQNVNVLAAGTKYYWRVAAWNDESYGTNQWSNVWTFNTSQAKVVLQSPANGSTGLDIPVELAWLPVETAESYHLQVAKDIDFTNVVVDKPTISGTNYTLTVMDVEAGTHYYWHIKGVNTQDNITWSSTWDFTTSGVSVKDNLLLNSIKLYPNPSGNNAVITINYPESIDAKIMISSSDGRILISDIISLNAGETRYEVDTVALSSGVYYITIITPSGFVTRELVITK